MKSDKSAAFLEDVLRFYNDWQDEHGELSTNEIVLVLSRWQWEEMKRYNPKENMTYDFG